MKNTTNAVSRKKRKKKHLASSCLICWILLPIAVIILLFLDGFGVYLFNTERLLVIGVGILVILLPFFSEVSIKSFSFKKDNSHNQHHHSS